LKPFGSWLCASEHSLEDRSSGWTSESGEWAAVESKFSEASTLEIGESQMNRLDKQGVLAKLYELCPEIECLGIQPVVLGKGNRY
jgi:hypothetical protein